MRIIALAVALVLAGCIAPREPAEMTRFACPPLPLLPDNPTAGERRLWTQTVIAQYVQCAKGHK